MQVTNIAPMAGSTATGNQNIRVPAPVQQTDPNNIYNSDEEMIEKYAIKPVKPCRYLREKVSGKILKYSIDFAARGDLVEEYNPSLAELVALGEDLSEVHSWGYKYEDFVAAGVAPEQLARYGIAQAPAAPAAPTAPEAPNTPPTPVAPATA